MGTKNPRKAGGFASSYTVYKELLESVGLEADPRAVARHIAPDERQQQQALALLESGEGEVSDEVATAMQGLVQSLRQRLTGADERFTDAAELPSEELADSFRQAARADRYLLADAVLLNGHRPFLKERYITAADFRDMVREHEERTGEELARVKLVPFLRRQFDMRGFSMSTDEVDALFDEAGEDTRVPACVEIILEQVDEDFTTGLIPFEELVGDEDPDEWLESVREKLLFRSHSSMHKAIAEASSLKYDCVHKALSGKKKAKRIQAEIKYCLDRWVKAMDAGREPDINPDYRGVPVEWTCELMEDLQPRYPTKEQIYRVISERTGIKSGSVRRYFQNCGQLKYAPLVVYQCAQDLLSEPVATPETKKKKKKSRKTTSRKKSKSKSKSRSKKKASRTGSGQRKKTTPDSYLEDARTRRAAYNLADRLSETLEQMNDESGQDDELEVEFLDLRRRLIATIKEQRHLAVIT